MFQKEQQLIEEKIKAFCSANDIAPVSYTHLTGTKSGLKRF